MWQLFLWPPCSCEARHPTHVCGHFHVFSEWKTVLVSQKKIPRRQNRRKESGNTRVCGLTLIGWYSCRWFGWTWSKETHHMENSGGFFAFSLPRTEISSKGPLHSKMTCSMALRWGSGKGLGKIGFKSQENNGGRKEGNLQWDKLMGFQRYLNELREGLRNGTVYTQHSDVAVCNKGKM